MWSFFAQASRVPRPARSFCVVFFLSFSFSKTSLRSLGQNLLVSMRVKGCFLFMIVDSWLAWLSSATFELLACLCSITRRDTALLSHPSNPPCVRPCHLYPHTPPLPSDPSLVQLSLIMLRKFDHFFVLKRLTHGGRPAGSDLVVPRQLLRHVPQLLPQLRVVDECIVLWVIDRLID